MAQTVALDYYSGRVNRFMIIWYYIIWLFCYIILYYMMQSYINSYWSSWMFYLGWSRSFLKWIWKSKNLEILTLWYGIYIIYIIIYIYYIYMCVFRFRLKKILVHSIWFILFLWLAFCQDQKQLYKLIASNSTVIATVLSKLGIFEGSDAAWENSDYSSTWEGMFWIACTS